MKRGYRAWLLHSGTGDPVWGESPKMPMVGARPGHVAQKFGISGLATTSWLRVGSNGIKQLVGKEDTGHSPGKGHCAAPVPVAQAPLVRVACCWSGYLAGEAHVSASAAPH